MPSQQGVLTNLDGLVWNKGYLYGTRSGGATDAIQFGALQNTRLSHSFEFAEIDGPESLSPLGIGTRRERLSGSFESGVVTPEQFMLAMGGNLSYAAGTARTTYKKLVNEEPKPFNLRYVSDDTADPEIECTLYRCLAPDWTILSAENRAWQIGGGSFNVHGESNGGRLFEFSKPGNLTNSS